MKIGVFHIQNEGKLVLNLDNLNNIVSLGTKVIIMTNMHGTVLSHDFVFPTEARAAVVTERLTTYLAMGGPGERVTIEDAEAYNYY